MCGRFGLSTTRENLKLLFRLERLADSFLWRPRFNIAPTQEVAVVRAAPHDGARELVMLRWGLIPFWANAATQRPQPINLRAETLARKFGGLLKTRRCLVLADGFYEWKRPAGGKGPGEPHFIRLKSGAPFGFAGVWDTWRDRSGTGEVIESCAILTTAPNAAVAPLHDRMPVILPPARAEAWLDRSVTDVDALQRQLEPVAAEELEAYRVGTRVNMPANDDVRCVERVP